MQTESFTSPVRITGTASATPEVHRACVRRVAYMPVIQGVEHDWLAGTVYFLGFVVLGCLRLGIAELVRLVSNTGSTSAE
jgi:hypothetical protein